MIFDYSCIVHLCTVRVTCRELSSVHTVSRKSKFGASFVPPYKQLVSCFSTYSDHVLPVQQLPNHSCTAAQLHSYTRQQYTTCCRLRDILLSAKLVRKRECLFVSGLSIHQRSIGRRNPFTEIPRLQNHGTTRNEPRTGALRPCSGRKPVACCIERQLTPLRARGIEHRM